MRVSVIWWIVIIVSAIAAILGMFSGAPSLPRTIATFWFLLVCPGMAYVRLLRLEQPVIEFTLAIALSISIDTFVTLAQVLAKAWSINVSMAIITAITTIGVVLQMMILPRLPVRQAAESQAS